MQTVQGVHGFISVGDWVERLGSSAHHLTGNKGEVLEIEEKGRKVRCRVHWQVRRNGEKIYNAMGGDGVRTWVRVDILVMRDR